MAKRHARRLERRYKRHGSDFCRGEWINALRDYHKLANNKRSSFWKCEVSDASNARQAWKTIDRILCRDNSVSLTPSISANDLSDYFVKKINGIRETTEGAGSPFYESNFSGVELLSFTPLSIADVAQLVREAPTKQCSFDPVPTWLLKDCIHLLAPFITTIINRSLTNGCVPSAFKSAHITPLLKKSGLDLNEACNYRPVSNLSFLSKILEKAVSRQLDSYLTVTKLFSSHQSTYRKFHSTEIILLRVTSDLVSHLDKGEVALMAFLELSAAFDPVDKEILLNRLSSTFGKFTVGCWSGSDRIWRIAPSTFCLTALSLQWEMSCTASHKDMS